MSIKNLTNFWTFSRKIAAVGRNYTEHAKELGNAVPTKPFFFLKPPTSFVRQGSPIEVPEPCQAEGLHHEVELGLVIGKQGRDIPASRALDHIGGYILALDMTARNLQNQAKEKGLPWTTAKGYDTFTPISDFIEKSRIPDPSNVELWLKVDGQVRQKDSTKNMIFKIPQLIEHISGIMTLEVGDVILTGTPPGVGPVKSGQTIEAGITGLLQMKFDVVNRKSKL